MARSVSRGIAFSAALALALVAPPIAADDIDECIAAHVAAQNAQRDGEFAEARRQLAFCVRDVCPAPISDDCTRWLSELEQRQPTVIITVTDETGASLSDVRVTVDGDVLVERLTGRTMPIDPGERKFRYEHADGRSVEETILITEGDTARRLIVSFPPKPEPVTTPVSPSVPPEAGDVPVAVWVLTAIAGVGLVGFAVLAGVGFGQEQDLASSCEPSCSQDDIDGVQRLYIAGDISGAVGIASGVAAFIIFAEAAW